MIKTTFILVCVKFQFNMPKVAKVMTARGIMGQQGLAWQNTPVSKFVV